MGKIFLGCEFFAIIYIFVFICSYNHNKHDNSISVVLMGVATLHILRQSNPRYESVPPTWFFQASNVAKASNILNFHESEILR